MDWFDCSGNLLASGSRDWNGTRLMTSRKVCDRRAIKPRGGVALKDFRLLNQGA